MADLIAKGKSIHLQKILERNFKSKSESAKLKGLGVSADVSLTDQSSMNDISINDIPQLQNFSNNATNVINHKSRKASRNSNKQKNQLTATSALSNDGLALED